MRFRYLREDLDVVIDAHSHENGGYNYTDVAHLIDSLGVPPTTVIGGHVWDPSLPQFQEWDRYRVPVAGERYPWASWRGDILMGSGTPNHVNDPLLSGVWRPQDRDNYFTHDVNGNMVAIGPYKATIESIPELIALYATGAVASPFMLTSNYNIRPSMIQRANGLVSITDSIITPVDAWRDAGTVLPTDFTTLVATWQSDFGSRGWFYDAETLPTDGNAFDAQRPIILESAFPNPFTTATALQFTVDRTARIRLRIFDVAGREVATLVDGERTPGRYAATWIAPAVTSGVYFCRLQANDAHVQERKLLLMR